MAVDIKNPLVSVIMPCYNHENYVAQSIESVLNQTYKNIEFIVLDNGSTDHSFEVIKQYEGKIHKILHVEKNDIEKAGIILRSECTGEYVAFMTSDDVWEKEKLEKQMKIFKENPHIKVCFTWANEVDENLMLRGESELFKKKNRNRYEWLRHLILNGNCFAYPSAVVEWKTYCAALSKLKLFYQLSDFYLWMQIILEHDVYVVEEPLVWFRWHPNGNNKNTSAINSNSIIRTWNESVIIIEEIIEQMDGEVFKKVFWDFIKNKEATRADEVCCEKFLLLLQLGKEQMAYQQIPIDFYYKHYCCIFSGYSFVKTLETVYHYTYKNFQDYCAQHGIGNLIMEIKQSEMFRSISVKQDKYLEALYEAVNAESEVDQRRIMWRRKVFSLLSDEQKEIVLLLIRCIDIVESMSNQEYSVSLKIVRDMQAGFEIIWNELLKWDKEFVDEEWETYKSIICDKNMEEDQYNKTMIPFLKKVDAILKDYIA